MRFFKSRFFALISGTLLALAAGPSAYARVHGLLASPLGFVVLAHCNPKPHKSPPHDHGSSWAVYGQAVRHTDMSEYKRLDGGNGASACAGGTIS